MWLFIADIILLLHFFVVIFITSLFFLVPIGFKYKWEWTRIKFLRLTHLILMFLITIETVLGITCPLTIIEHNLRNFITSHSFVSYWISKFIYWDLPTSFFLMLYIICLIWTIYMWIIYPPNKIIKQLS